jgi:hypothetical protein
MMKNVAVFLCALAVCAISGETIAALSLPSYLGSGPIQQMNSLFVPAYGTGQASVTSKVYNAASGGYIYSYQISETTANFTWFSVALNPGTSITSYGYDSSGITPMDWSPVDSPATSIEALFSTSVKPTNTSSLLWFTSPNAPEINTLGGALAKNGAYTVGDVWAPVPEPMTAILLGAGWLALRSWKRKG